MSDPVAHNLIVGTGNNETLSDFGNVSESTMIGGAGNDTYIIDSPYNLYYMYGASADVVVEAAGGGTDTVVLTDNGRNWSDGSGWGDESYWMTDNVENLKTDFAPVQYAYYGHLALTDPWPDYFAYGAHDLEIHGNSLNNAITTGSGDDVIYGGGGKDTLAGGDGNDDYYVDSSDDVVIEQAHVVSFSTGYAYGGGMYHDAFFYGGPVIPIDIGGVDSVYSTATFTLGANVENLYLGEGAGNINGTGNQSNNDIVGNSENNQLSGLGGNDWMQGGGGNDKLLGGDGNDDLHGDSWDLDNYVAAGGNDSLDGGNGDDVLNGGYGNDTLLGGTGNDILYGGAFTSGPGNVDAGKDSLVGGTGDDRYYAFFGDTVTEAAGGGTDTVYLYGGGWNDTYTLAANVEDGVLWQSDANLTGNASDNRLTGNEMANVLTGLAGNDMLDGGSSNDTLIGGAGNDSYIIRGFGDKVVEDAGAGTDTVYYNGNGMGYTLGANVENLTLVTGYLGTGNSGNNVITGNSWGNVLDGGAGNDTLDGGVGDGNMMKGGAGNDTYIVRTWNDHIVETGEAGSGTADKVILTPSADVGAYYMVPNLEILDASALNWGLYVHANNASNTITTGAGNDSLDGASGADSMVGGKGNDTYFVDNAGDKVVENANEGTYDTVWDLGVNSYTLSANVENLILGGLNADGTGNTLANMIIGNSANNVLDGGDGNDSLYGGYGQDTLKGGNNDDWLDGGAKADSMSGGAGNDTYVIDNTGDVVAGETAGNDTIRTSLASFSLTSTVAGGVAAVENLIYTGSSSFSGGGNALNNSIVGGDYNDTLIGAAGNDTLDGGEGGDIMGGGAGDDTYYVGMGDLINLEAVSVGGGGKDTVISRINYSLADSIAGGVNGTDGLNGDTIENLKLVGSAYMGTGNILANTITGNAWGNDGGIRINMLFGGLGNDTLIGSDASDSSDTLDGGAGADSMSGGKGQDEYYVDNTGDVVVETTADSLGGGYDIVFSKVNFTLGANLNALTLNFVDSVAGANDINGTGNALDNMINGNLGNNVISGLDGNDWLRGGYGNDTLSGGNGNDNLQGGAGADSMSGGAGNDGYDVNDVGDKVVEASGGGTDTVYAYGGLTSFNMATNAANVENFNGGWVSGFDTLTGGFNLTGNALDNVMYGSWIVDNNIDAGNGNDTIWLDMVTGSPTLVGGTGTDSVNGGAGTDTLHASIGHYGGPANSYFSGPIVGGNYGGNWYTTDEVSSSLSGIENVVLEVNGGFYYGYDVPHYGGLGFYYGSSHYGGGHTGGGSWDVGGLDGTGSAHVQFTITSGWYGSGTLELEGFGDNVDFTVQDYHLDANYGGLAFFGDNWVGTGDTLQVTLDNAEAVLRVNPTANPAYGGVETLKLISQGGPDVMGGANTVWVHNVFADDSVSGAVSIDVSGDTNINVLGIQQTFQSVNLHDFTGFVDLELNGDGPSDTLDLSINNVSAGLSNYGIGYNGIETLALTNTGENLLEVSGLYAADAADTVPGGTSITLEGDGALQLQGVMGNVYASAFTGNLLAFAADASNIVSGSGDDYLVGSSNSDTLNGGEGDDVLIGGDGSDVFVFNGTPAASGYYGGIDLISDFQSGSDQIQVDFAGLGFDSVTGALNSSQFYSAPNADDNASGISGPMVMYDTSTGALYYDADGNNGVINAVQFAQLGLGSAPGLSASDIHAAPV